jgi:hypothetical protein
MSHTTTYKQKIKDIDLFCMICENNGHKVKKARKGENLSVNHYYGNTVDNCSAEILLKGWEYPLAIKKNGEILYDHFGSKPNTMEILGETLQEYHNDLIFKNFDMTQINNYQTSTNEDQDIILTLEYN